MCVCFDLFFWCYKEKFDFILVIFDIQADKVKKQLKKPLKKRKFATKHVAQTAQDTKSSVGIYFAFQVRVLSTFKVTKMILEPLRSGYSSGL